MNARRVLYIFYLMHFIYGQNCTCFGSGQISLFNVAHHTVVNLFFSLKFHYTILLMDVFRVMIKEH